MNGDTRNRTVKCVRLTYATVCARKNSYSYGHNINLQISIDLCTIELGLGYTIYLPL